LPITTFDLILTVAEGVGEICPYYSVISRFSIIFVLQHVALCRLVEM